MLLFQCPQYTYCGYHIFCLQMYIMRKTSCGCCETRKKDILHLQRHSEENISLPAKAVSLVVKFQLVVIIGLLLLGVSMGVNVKGAHAQSHVTHTTQSTHVANMPSTTAGSYNWFPYPSCTWWANQRYHQLHGVFVPWRTQANAGQWTARAYQFGWHVSSRASQGAIIDLQPWVQGAYGLGHVAVVERVYSDGSVLASNMNWGSNPNSVAYVHFHPGSGVTFIQ